MTPSTLRSPRAALPFAPPFFLLVAFSLAVPGRAFAQDPFATDAPPGPRVPEAGKSEAPAGDSAAPAEPASAAAVERMPSTAFPEWRTRGIYGGSLWLTFHGMQWPYYPKTGLGISGYGWVDTGYEYIARGNPSEATEEKYMLQQGRGLIRFTPTYSHGSWFVQAQAELVANKDQTQSQSSGSGLVDVDDLWVRTGHWKKWDVTLGRFEGFEVYHFGMGLDLNTLERQGAIDRNRPLPDVQGIIYGYLRPGSVGNAAFHFYIGDSLRIELLAQLGNENGLNTIGGRPAVIYDLGWLKLKASAVFQQQTSVPSSYIEKRKVFAATGAAQVVLAPVAEFGVNADYGYIDHWTPMAAQPMPGQTMGDFDPGGSTTTVSFGGFANVRVLQDVLLGVGGNFVKQEDALPDMTNPNTTGQFSHLQAFGAVQYLIHKQLFIKAVGGYARGHIDRANDSAVPWDNSMVSGRVRLLYLF